MCRHFREDFGFYTQVACFHKVYGPHGTWDGGREKAPAAIRRKVIQAKVSGRYEINTWGGGEGERGFFHPWIIFIPSILGRIRLYYGKLRGSFQTVRISIRLKWAVAKYL